MYSGRALKMSVSSPIRIIKKQRHLFRLLPLAVFIGIWLERSNIYSVIYNYAFATPYRHFKYPLDIDMNKIVDLTLNGEQHELVPINNPQFPYMLGDDNMCKDREGDHDDIYVLMLIKSSLGNSKHRNMIRRTWAGKNVLAHVNIRHVFLLGIDPDNKTIQRNIDLEHKENGDIVQHGFYDTYYNNTYKTMSGYKWAVSHCRSAKYLAFFDDDFYVSVYNMVRMLQSIPEQDKNSIIGYVHAHDMPTRYPFDKWVISLTDYEYRRYPPFAIAGAVFVPFHIAERINIAIIFTKHYRFDDVFIGIVARKLGVKFVHNKNVYNGYLRYNARKYADVVAVHGYGDADNLYKVWHDQENAGQFVNMRS